MSNGSASGAALCEPFPVSVRQLAAAWLCSALGSGAAAAQDGPLPAWPAVAGGA